ncbi:MAG: oxidoreductase [Nevskia sp.]|nr:oxidoreductase [Nevskia sp.]
MSRLIRGNAVSADDWTELDDATAVPSTAKVIVSLARWRAERETLAAATAIGVRVDNSADIQTLWPELRDLPLVALEFPKSGDGRAFSQARLLREHCGYQGEIRAIGDVQRDHLQAMQRCGFDAFVPRDDQDLDDCLRALHEFDLAYQRAARDDLPLVWRLRRQA